MSQADHASQADPVGQAGSPGGAGSLVTLQVWRIRPAAVPMALWRMAVDRRRLRRLPGVGFAKLLGTGAGRRFGPAAGDPLRWAALISWSQPQAAAGFGETPVAAAWERLAVAGCRFTLAPLSSRGSWSGRAPFAATRGGHHPAAARGGHHPAPGGTPILVLTRARLRPARAATFWRAIGPAAAPLETATGLRAAFGIGEAPIGFQGTISVWSETADLVRFAYRLPQHAAVAARSTNQRWYAEELFARFAVLDVAGDRSVVGWTEADA